jgi:exonuclease VII large subunit
MQQQQDQRHQQQHVSHQLQQQQHQPASSQHRFQSQLPQRQPQQDQAEEQVGQYLPLNLSHPLQELPQEDQRLQENEEDYPLGHPKNKIGCKRAKKIQQLERQMAQTKTEIKKVADFQSKVMSDAVDAAKLSMVDFFSDFRQQLIDSVVEIVYNRGDERRYVHGSVTAVRGGDSQEQESIVDDVDANTMEDEGDVLCTAYVPAPTVAPSYDIDPLIEFNFSG